MRGFPDEPPTGDDGEVMRLFGGASLRSGEATVPVEDGLAAMGDAIDRAVAEWLASAGTAAGDDAG